MANEREYIFASSFLKACDAVGTPAERLARYGEAQSRDALKETVAEAYSVALSDDVTVYEAVIYDAVKKLKSALPDFTLMYPLLYKYDCTNIKTAVKCAVMGIDCSDMLFSVGTADKSIIRECAEKSSFAAAPLPPAMKKGADEAMRQYRKTGESRLIDLILDDACFEDMTRAADEGGAEIIKNTVKLRADGANTTAAMRISAMGLPAETAASLMKRAYVCGGDIPLSSFLSPEGGCSNIDGIIKKLPFSALCADAVKKCSDAKSFADAEKIFDEAVLSMCRKYRFKPFGIEVAVCFLLIREAEMTNCRIIEASLSSGDTAVLERMRKAYV